MRSPICLLLLLSLSLAACTNKPAGSENANPDANRYASLTDKDQWEDFIRERERDLSASDCRIYYSYGTCAEEGVSLATLNKRHLAWKRYISALKSASLSGKFSKYDSQSMERRADNMEKQDETFAKAFKGIRERRARQDRIIAKLNQTSCKVTRVEDNEREEISLKDCDPSKTVDSANVTSLLAELMDNSTVRDRSNYRLNYDRYRAVTPKYAELARIKQSLLDRGVISISGSAVSVNGAGNPFGGTADLADLGSYAKVAKEIATTLGSSDSCVSPCERSLYDVAAAVIYNPMESYCSGTRSNSAPSADYLKTWYNLSNSAQLTTLRLNFNTSGREFSSEVYSENVLSFPYLFRSHGVTLTISNWRSESSCSQAAQLFFYLQEAESLISFLKRIGSDSAARVREVRFVPSSSSARLRAVSTGDGYIRLEVATIDRVNPAKSVALTRDEIYRAIPDALAGVAR